MDISFISKAIAPIIKIVPFGIFGVFIYKKFQYFCNKKKIEKINERIEKFKTEEIAFDKKVFIAKNETDFKKHNLTMFQFNKKNKILETNKNYTLDGLNISKSNYYTYEKKKDTLIVFIINNSKNTIDKIIIHKKNVPATVEELVFTASAPLVFHTSDKVLTDKNQSNFNSL